MVCRSSIPFYSRAPALALGPVDNLVNDRRRQYHREINVHPAQLTLTSSPDCRPTE
jgi:hypothetical protein